MEKNSYEMYEYLTVPTNNSNAESDQFFIVQDDETFFVNKQSSVQYVTEMTDQQESLENVQQCTVYDVSSQQIYVDVDNTAELISVPGELILPDTSSNLYSNSYLLQSLPSTSTTQEGVMCNQFKDEDEMDATNIIMDENKQIDGNCTEITLNDEQYTMLQEKGWVLLETKDKVYILDTLGLHDITSNEELIQQMKMDKEIAASLQPDIRTENIQVEPASSNITEKNTTENNPVQFVLKNDILQTNLKKSNVLEVSMEENPVEEKNNEDINSEIKENVCLEPIEKPTTILIKAAPISHDDKIKSSCSVIKLNAKFNIKDFPDRMVLGRTPSGKKLVAKVTYNSAKRISNGRKSNGLSKKEALKKSESESHEWQWDNLVKKSLSNLKTDPDQLHAIIEIIKQMLLVPDFLAAVNDAERKLFITKAIKSKDTNCERETILPNVVTGRVINVDKSQQFVHIPDLLKNLMDSKKSAATRTDMSRVDSVLHVHITETNNLGNIEGISVTYNKQQLPKLSESSTPVNYTTNKNQKPKVYACSYCATTFAVEADLLQHQENDCMETEDTLTIVDTELDAKENEKDAKPAPYYIFKTKSGTLYACLQCQAKFKKLHNCQRHIKTHSSPKNCEEKSESQKPLHKCKMCPSSYFHLSSLSKHIVQSHIKVNKI